MMTRRRWGDKRTHGTFCKGVLAGEKRCLALVFSLGGFRAIIMAWSRLLITFPHIRVSGQLTAIYSGACPFFFFFRILAYTPISIFWYTQERLGNSYITLDISGTT